MYKLMRMLLILTVLGLAVAATPAPKVEAIATCTAESLALSVASDTADVLCDTGTDQQCADATAAETAAMIRYAACKTAHRCICD